jgi:hypothetical protein
MRGAIASTGRPFVSTRTAVLVCMRTPLLALATIGMLACGGAAPEPHTAESGGDPNLQTRRGRTPEPEPFDLRGDPDFVAIRRIAGDLKEIEQRANALSQEFRRDVVWLECGAGRVTCGLIAHQFQDDAFVAEFSKNECAEPFGKGRTALSERCTKKYFAEFTDALIGRYVAGDPAAVDTFCKAERLACVTMVRYEIAWLKSHNAAVIADYQQKRGELQATRAAAIAESGSAQRRLQVKREGAERRYERALEAREVERRQEQEELQRRVAAANARRAEEEADANATRVAVAAVLGGVAAGMVAYAATMNDPAFTPAEVAGCSSDYDCGPGRTCAKRAGEMTGTCARRVNGYGTPSYGHPNPSSFGPGQWQCPCDIGFRCDSGRCIR